MGSVVGETSLVGFYRTAITPKHDFREGRPPSRLAMQRDDRSDPRVTGGRQYQSEVALVRPLPTTNWPVSSEAWP
jgi:hypothetical protein